MIVGEVVFMAVVLVGVGAWRSHRGRPFATPLRFCHCGALLRQSPSDNVTVPALVLYTVRAQQGSTATGNRLWPNK